MMDFKGNKRLFLFSPIFQDSNIPSPAGAILAAVKQEEW